MHFIVEALYISIESFEVFTSVF